MRNRITSIGVVIALLLLGSCKKDLVSISDSQSSAVEDQSTTEGYFNEAGDMSTNAYNTPTSGQLAGGRTNGTVTLTVDGDNRFHGAVVTLVSTGTNPLIPQGTITIDFGTGQTDPKGNFRKGQIIVTYSGLRWVPNSTIVITFNNYLVNGISIEGTRTITTTSFTASPLSVTFGVVDTGGKATFQDQTTVTREATHTHKITLGTTVAESTWTVTGQSNGKTRKDQDYQFVITRDLVFKTSCALNLYFLPSEGAALFTVSGQPFDLNYGDAGASCDNIVTVTINGFSKDILVRNN